MVQRRAARYVTNSLKPHCQSGIKFLHFWGEGVGFVCAPKSWHYNQIDDCGHTRQKQKKQAICSWLKRLSYLDEPIHDWKNRQRLRIPGLGNIFGPFFFEFSKVNVLKINLTKIFFNVCCSKPHKNLRWNDYVNNICNKANRTIGFLKRNPNIGFTTVKQNAYKALVPALVEYASTV